MAKITVKLKLKGGVKKHDRIYDIVAQGVNEIKLVNGYEDLKLDRALTKSVMIAVREGCRYVDGKVDKSEIVLKILTDVYNLSEDEIKSLVKRIIY